MKTAEEVEKGIKKPGPCGKSSSRILPLLAAARLYELDKMWMESQKRTLPVKENG